MDDVTNRQADSTILFSVPELCDRPTWPFFPYSEINRWKGVPVRPVWNTHDKLTLRARPLPEKLDLVRPTVRSQTPGICAALREKFLRMIRSPPCPALETICLSEIARPNRIAPTTGKTSTKKPARRISHRAGPFAGFPLAERLLD